MNKKTKRLGLNKETLRQMDATELSQAAGGTMLAYTFAYTCKCWNGGSGGEYNSLGDGQGGCYPVLINYNYLTSR